jgi:hypothetical protein
MELNILARSKVATPRRVIVRKSRQDAQLVRLQDARCDLDTQHLEPRLPLAIGAVLQTKGPELFRGDGAVLKLLNALFEALNLRLDGFGCVSLFDFGQNFHAHDAWLPTSLPSSETSAIQKQKSPHDQALWHVGFGTL